MNDRSEREEGRGEEGEGKRERGREKEREGEQGKERERENLPYIIELIVGRHPLPLIESSMPSRSSI
jgi:hypothetical protein